MKGKVVPVLPLTEHHAMKAYWGVEDKRHDRPGSLQWKTGSPEHD